MRCSNSFIIRYLYAAWDIICVLGIVCTLASCQWHKANQVIAMADSLDVTQHVIYDDTVALRKAIYALNDPVGRTFKRSTLAKAYYYMGRNLQRRYNQVERAAVCYIEADNDPGCRHPLII